MSPLRKLGDRDGTPCITLENGEIGLGGVLDERESDSDGSAYHIQRLSRGVYVVRAVDDDGIPELLEVIR